MRSLEPAPARTPGCDKDARLVDRLDQRARSEPLRRFVTTGSQMCFGARAKMFGTIGNCRS
jgi:hypothetical protein